MIGWLSLAIGGPPGKVSGQPQLAPLGKLPRLPWPGGGLPFPGTPITLVTHVSPLGHIIYFLVSSSFFFRVDFLFPELEASLGRTPAMPFLHALQASTAPDT